MSNLIINNKYFIMQKLGEGASSKVFLVKDMKSKKLFACKFQNISHKNLIENETNFLSQFSHKNIIKKIDEGEFELQHKKLKFIIFDYCEHGRLSDYICFGFGERYGKYLFNIILETVNEIHNFGFAHRDLKLENILLDKWFNVKIGDFGFCTLLKRNLKNFLGTFCYAAPEILMRKKYDGKKIDIFSLGIILFVIVTGKKFFLMKETEFFYLNYKNNAKENYEKFIAKLDKECLNFSLNFRDLCFKMIKFEPDERPDYFDIKNHEWLKNIDVSQFEMENHFKSRDDFVRDKIEEDKILKEIEGDKNCESFWFL